MNIKKAYPGRLPCFCSVGNDTESGNDLTGGRSPVTRAVRLNGMLAWLCLATGALALPLSAEEITVTVPPDPAPQAAAANPAPAAPLPSFSMHGLQTSEADTDAADQGTAATPPAPPPPPATTSNTRPSKHLLRRPSHNQRLQRMQRLTNRPPIRLPRQLIPRLRPQRRKLM